MVDPFAWRRVRQECGSRLGQLLKTSVLVFVAQGAVLNLLEKKA